MGKRVQHSGGRKSGQAIIFLVMVLFIGTIVVLWNFDLHNIVSTKVRVDTAGDAGALSAARWQGITLNMLGELNLVQAAYMCDEIANIDMSATEAEIAEALTNLVDDVEENIVPLRRRMALCGPLMGMVAAQSSALLNLTDKDEDNIEESTSDYMAERGAEFESCGTYYMDVVEEPYDDAWAEYGALLSGIAENDMVVDCMNAEFFVFYSSMSHWLLREGFYNAVNYEWPCYFDGSSASNMLVSYSDYTSWDDLPDLADRAAVNSEYFGTYVYEYESQISLGNFFSHTNGQVSAYTNYYTDSDLTSGDLYDEFKDQLEGTSPTSDVDVDSAYGYLMALECTWHYFPPDVWMSDSGYSSGKYFPDSDDFQFEDGWKFKDHYNYGGAEAVVQAQVEAEINTPGMQLVEDNIESYTAAKPFGCLTNLSTGETVAPMYYGLVLPAFHDARLIHSGLAQSASSSSGGSSEWLEHIYVHVPAYLEGGTAAIEDNDCEYCQAIIKWDETDFREEVIEWLEDNDCSSSSGSDYSGTPVGSK